jgi:iron(III) transport system ATP-binding protein
VSIDVAGLSKSFGDVRVVRNIDLRVDDGKMLVLLGPSGCGKTTTMRCIAGLDVPEAGRISIGGKVVYDAAAGINVSADKRNVGMVFQSYAIWPHMTVYQNVAFSLEITRTPRAETKERVEAMLELVGLGGLGARGASQLSGGQMQRVALARSLVTNPSVLLLDEPLSNLDARLRDYLRVQLREIQTSLKITALYVTHDQHEALSLADEIVVLDAGAILQRGAPMAMYYSPESSAVAQFLGYSNIFPGSIHAGDAAGCEVVLHDGDVRVFGKNGNTGGRDSVAVCVRPNDIVLSAASVDAAAHALPPNTYPAEVIYASFEGTQVHYRARTDAGTTWDIVSADVQGALPTGTRALVRIAEDRVLILPHSSAELAGRAPE